jgi:hypothetical protein
VTKYRLISDRPIYWSDPTHEEKHVYFIGAIDKTDYLKINVFHGDQVIIEQFIGCFPTGKRIDLLINKFGNITFENYKSLIENEYTFNDKNITIY